MSSPGHLAPAISRKATLYLLLSCLMPACVGQRASIRSPGASGCSRPGDVVIGGIFPVHVDAANPASSFAAEPAPTTCQTFVRQHFQWLQAMVFAVEDINRRPDLLPNVTLGFQIYDSCVQLRRSLEGTLWILTGQDPWVVNYQCQRRTRLAGIVGEAGSTHSIALARLLGVYRYPQVSYFSSSPLLSERIQFPSFFRTIPSDDFQSRGLAQLVIHFGWTWVGLLAEDNDYGQLGIQIMKQELVQAGACVAFSENIVTSLADRNAFHIVQVVKASSAQAIVIFSLDEYLLPILDEFVRQNVTGKIWIASEAWSTSALLSMQKYSTILVGTIGFAIHSGAMPGFERYLIGDNPCRSPGDILRRSFWEEAFNCKWLNQEALDNTSRPCTMVDQLDDLKGATLWRVAYNVYTAVYAIALALQNLISCRPGRGPFLHGSCAGLMDFQPWQLLHYLGNINTTDEEGSRSYFDQSGNPLARYDIINWQLGPDGTPRQVTVGTFDPGKNLLLNASAILWSSGTAQIPVSVCAPSCHPGFRKVAIEGAPICCFHCVPCPQGEISSQTDSVDCSKCPKDHWPNTRQDRCIPKTPDFLTFDEPLGSTLAASSISLSLITVAILGLFIHSRNTPIVKANNRSLSYLLLLSLTLCFLCSLAFIGYPTPEKCLLRQAAFGITFALCVSCILAKTIMVVIAFNATKPNSDLRRWVGTPLSYMVISICTLLQVLLCVSWLTLSPSFSEYNTHTEPRKIIVECNEGSPIAFWCMLGYLGLLATICFLVAFLARQLPDSFNETKFITFSMLAFLSVWISFIPAYLSTRGKYMVAMEIFAILSSSCALVSCIFFPKCYILIFRPEKNSRKYLMGRGQ